MTIVLNGVSLIGLILFIAVATLFFEHYTLNKPRRRRRR